ncbi:MAG: baseplate J/gp47 family protein [Gemmatimonadales bacterium]
MPLPLPNLDTRRWADLVDEGVALVPRYGGSWTDHNAHDPGITLIELFAYLVEGLLYRVNRIPERHRRKFMALAGFTARPPRPARGVVQARLVTGTARLDLPAGVVLSAMTDQGPVGFSLASDVTFTEARLRAVQVFDGSSFTDRTRPALGRIPFAAFGPNPAASNDPDRSPAIYLGFDRALIPGVAVSLAFFSQDARDGEAEAIENERSATGDCRPPRPEFPCRPCPPSPWCADPASGDPDAGALHASLLAHHSARVVWEYRALDRWRPLSEAAGDVEDPTRSFSLDGIIRIRVPGPMADIAVGGLPESLHWLRCRFVAGEFDDAPVLIGPLENAAAVVQRVAYWRRFDVAAGAVMTAPPLGAPGPIDLELDDDGRVTRLEPAADDGRPRIRVLEFAAPTGTTPWVVSLAAQHAVTGSGFPGHLARLGAPQVSDGAIEVATLEPAGWRPWETRVDLDASGPHDRHVTLDAPGAIVRFGNGVRGRVLPDGAPALVAFATTRAQGGNVRAGVSWSIVDDAWNRALLALAGQHPATANARVASMQNPIAARDGADQESLESVERRAAEALWAHERLVQLMPMVEPATLDQTDRAAVRARSAPARATTIADYERLAIAVPGTRVTRARAWANLDPNLPCLDAEGTVTVVIVPSLPRGRPVPGRGLIRTVRRYLERRRVLGTRLLVVGPEYLTVEVRATVRAHRTADAGQVASRIRLALDEFLDPLRGGPAGLGWPFGRDVYRSEILSVIDGVAGVDHVRTCSLVGGGRPARCENLCVPQTWLVASGNHTIEVDRP